MIGLLFAFSALRVSRAQETAVRFAVIGDYGVDSTSTVLVADLVKSWSPDFIITVGDNNYPDGSAETIDAHIGQQYHGYIAPYVGAYGDGAAVNRFFPALGNHDWLTAGAQPYFAYFTLPGNERYYTFTVGSVQLFALDANYDEPDGISADSVQAAWLRDELAASTTTWQIVYGHIPPYSSGYHGSYDVMQWDFAEMGADAVLSGHDHTYERLLVDGIPYFVNGLGGVALYDWTTIVDGSAARYNANFGAMLITATAEQLTFEFYTVRGRLIDRYIVQQ